jgi:hypothetical protein
MKFPKSACENKIDVASKVAQPLLIITVPVPAPYLDRRKQLTKIAFLMLIEATLIPRNLLNEGNQKHYFKLILASPVSAGSLLYCR